MKGYTDFEQSRKLTKILPIESADMGYNGIENRDTRKIRYDNVATTMPNMDSIPCWSLAALLGVLPKNLNIGRPSLESNYKGYYWIKYYDEFMKPNNYKTKCFSNPVDACVAMVEKLHELKML